MPIQEMKVKDLINAIHDNYHDRLSKLQIENHELKLYKEATKDKYNSDLVVDNINLRKEVDKLKEEIRCWKKYGTPF